MKRFLSDPRYPKFFYQGVFGVGKSKLQDPSKTTFFASDFFSAPLQKRKGSLWKDFPHQACYQPEDLWKADFEPTSKSFPTSLDISFSPDESNWHEMIGAFHKSPLEKAVLARIVSLTFSKPLDPFSILSHLLERRLDETVFAFFPKPGVAFLGATPEKLMKREKKMLYTEALAGTRTLDKADELLKSQKDLSEFLFVKREIGKKLNSIAKPFAVDDQILIKKNRHLAHLHFPFACELKDDTSDKNVISLLHPTPATSGYPIDLSLNFIKEIEPFDRGWYAGPLGLLDDQKSEVTVSLRSALVVGKKMHIFTGAGIVADSNSESEWNELNAKMRTFGAFYDPCFTG